MSQSKTPPDLIPFSQITIKLQGTRHTPRQEILALLDEVSRRLSQGEEAGEHEVDGFGYVFETEVTLIGPSIFSPEVESRVRAGSLREMVLQQLGPQALSRLDEMLPVHRAALERRYRRDSRKVEFLSSEYEEAVLDEAFRRLRLGSKAEQRAIFRAMGFEDEEN